MLQWIGVGQQATPRPPRQPSAFRYTLRGIGIGLALAGVPWLCTGLAWLLSQMH